MDAVHGEGIEPGSVRQGSSQGPQSGEGVLGDLFEMLKSEQMKHGWVRLVERGTGLDEKEGRLQVRAKIWNKLSSTAVQNGTLLAPTDRQRTNNPSFVSGTGRRQPLSFSPDFTLDESTLVSRYLWLHFRVIEEPAKQRRERVKKTFD